MTTTTPEFVYDPSTAAFQEELWSVYRTMRDHYPVYRNPNTGAFALSRLDDVWQVVHDPKTYSNYSEDADTLLPQISFMDAPRHTALRALVSRAFTPARVAEIEPLARETARRLCDHIEPRGECDLQHDFAAILPSVIVARMIGVDDEHVMSFREWTEGFVEITSPEDFAEPAAKIYALFAEVLAERHARPRADMMTALIDAEIDGEHLTDEERLGFCMNLILGGNDTTSSLIGSGMVHLAENPDQRRLLLDNPSLWGNAVEEMLRIDSPAQALAKTTTRPVELHGVTIPAESRVMLVWGSANHDDREFADPERFDVQREFSRHLAFGHGTHYCLGANLARLEARIAFEEWHRRFPDYEIAEVPTRAVSNWARAYTRIPLKLK